MKNESITKKERKEVKDEKGFKRIIRGVGTWVKRGVSV